MLESIPFSWRVITLLSLMGIVGTVDRIRNGPKATRFREYGFIILTGIIGSLIAMGCDSVTSSISPEYFVLGKDLPQEDFGKQVLLFGAKTGFSGGAVTGAILLFACGTKLQNGWRNILRNL